MADPLARAVWSAAWAGTAGLVIVYRLGLPVLRSARHRLRVVEVRPEAPGVVSVILQGRRVESLAIAGGQFFEWRFLVPGLWWQAHPFSISARPQAPYLRLTVKVVGDFTSAVARLRPGTAVIVEGPYGAFTTHACRRTKVALIAGGIGVTAARSLLEDCRGGPSRSWSCGARLRTISCWRARSPSSSASAAVACTKWWAPRSALVADWLESHGAGSGRP